MKTKKHLTIAIVLLFIGINIQAQQEVVENSEGVIIISEDDIISLAKTLKAIKKVKTNKESLSYTEISTVQKNNSEASAFEVDYLRNEIARLENIIEEFNNVKVNTNSGLEYDSKSLDRRELSNLKYEIGQLKNLIWQIADKNNNDLTIVVPTSEPIKVAKLPVDSKLNEQIRSNNEDNMALKSKLDSLNSLFRNLKPADNPDYSSDFNTLENRIAALQKELTLRNSQPNTYEVLVSKYKGYSKSIFFSNNSIVLNTEGNQVVEALNDILDKNDNVDIVVKGFASNKGSALYNENLSMQRTEAVKKALILRGIHPTRVLTQYHGIDYSAQPDNARRVEISILVRK